MSIFPGQPCAFAGTTNSSLTSQESFQVVLQSYSGSHRAGGAQSLGKPFRSRWKTGGSTLAVRPKPGRSREPWLSAASELTKRLRYVADPAFRRGRGCRRIFAPPRGATRPAPAPSQPEETPCAGLTRASTSLLRAPEGMGAHGSSPWAEGPRVEPGHGDTGRVLSARVRISGWRADCRGAAGRGTAPATRSSTPRRHRGRHANQPPGRAAR